jgi:DUF1680 family protein
LLHRKVALKFLPPEMQRDATAHKRFIREARSAAALDHPYICHINEVAESDGRNFIVMEYVDGQSLKDRLLQGPLPLKDALQIAIEVTEALEAAHGKGIIHRDIKPGNIMLTQTGHAQVMDFGLAKQLIPSGEAASTDETVTALTSEGAAVGTLAYMSPEQLRGRAADARSDIWALGVTLYEMAAGMRPFEGASGFELSSAFLNQAPRPLPSQVPAELRAVIERCLEKEAAKRYQQASEARAALEAVRAGTAAPWAVWRYRLARRRWLMWAAVLVIIAAVLVGLDVGSLLVLAQVQVKDYAVRPAPIASVHVTDEFWAPRLEINRTVTLWHVFNQAEAAGEFDNFAKAAGLMEGPFRGSSPARDSDAYSSLEKYVTDLVAKIVAAQEPDGYIYTARRITPPEKMPEMSGPERWTRERTSHETYVMGLLCESGIAYYQATGKRTLLDAAIRSANLLYNTFGPAADQRHDTSGHEEIELALVKLYRATGDERFLRLSQYFVEQRGRRTPNYGTYAQDHKPVVEQTEAVGHAVRAGYLYAGVTDLACLTGNPAYIESMDRIWHNVVDRRMYLTGGLGARRDGEAFGGDYELPSMTGYNETCAAVASAFWQQRLFLLHRDAKYVDVLERTLYNGVLGGISLSGDRFFYTNVLESDGSRARSARMPWFTWPCCPTNIARILPSIPGFIYATSGDALYVNLFIGGSADIQLGEGKGARQLRLTQETRYPWDGNIKLSLAPSSSFDFTIHLRIPGWAQVKPLPGDLYRYAEKEVPAFKLSVNGMSVTPAIEKGYAVLRGTWKRGDTIELSLPMPIHRVLGNDAIEAVRGRMALERGPLVYCLEGIDHNGKARSVVLPAGIELVAEHRKDLLGGVTVIRTGNSSTPPVVAIPYYTWSNRGDGEMCVWISAK